MTNNIHMKSRVFIGSSSESLNVAKTVKNCLKSQYECTIWKDDSFFELNEDTYHTLIRESIGFDFAIFIGGKDDLAQRCGKKDANAEYKPRDNVYLEFGLYAGILSVERSFFLIHKDCKIASDLCGITIESYKNQDDIIKSCRLFREKMKQEEQLSRITLLPSTSLAIGYVDNYLAETAMLLEQAETIVVDGQSVPIGDLDKQLDVVIPEDVETDWKLWLEFYYREHQAKKIQLQGRNRVYDVRLDYKSFQNEQIVRVMDVPLTLISAFSAVDLFVGKNYLGEKETLIRAKKREVYNFIKTLNIKTRNNSYMKKLVHIVTA